MPKITQGKPFVFDEICELFQFLNPYDNSCISSMSQEKLALFFKYLNRYLPSLREHLNFDDSVTFGLELEFEYNDMARIKYNLSRHHFLEDWKIDWDDKDLQVMEVTSPILLNNLDNWLALHKVATNISKYAKVGKSSGGHIHIGAHLLGTDPVFWYYLALLWEAYEHIIFRHCYGERNCARSNIINYAQPMKSHFERVIEYCHRFLEYEEYDLYYIQSCLAYKFQAVNFKHVKIPKLPFYAESSTIEFRNPNGTLDPVIWQNNVNLFVYMLKYVRSEKFDWEKVMWRKDQNDCLSLPYYDQLFLRDALEFCDMIFPTNLDKIYFLKQYLKNDSKVYQRARVA